MITNIKAAELLVLRYRSITEEEVRSYCKETGLQIQRFPKLIKQHLTGFGSSMYCTLCKTIRDELGFLECYRCIYGDVVHCVSGEYYDSYIKIYDAKTIQDYIQAIRERADVIEKRL